MSSDSEKLKAVLRMADPEKNSSYQERKNALDLARKIMDKTGLSYASLGISQSDAERIENQFSVTANTQPRKTQKEGRISIFSRSDEIAISTPRRKQQPAPSRQKPTVQIPNYEAEHDRKEREEWDNKYSEWQKWRRAENVREAENEEAGRKLARTSMIVFCFVIVVGALIILSQNAVIISAAALLVKVVAGIIFALLVFFAFFVLR